MWAYRVTPQGETESLSATAVVRARSRSHRADLSLSRGETIVSIEGADLEVAIVLKDPDAPLAGRQR